MQIHPDVLEALAPIIEKGFEVELATFDEFGLNGNLNSTAENTIGIIRNKLTGKMMDFIGFEGSEVFHDVNVRGTIHMIAELMETGPSKAIH